MDGAIAPMGERALLARLPSPGTVLAAYADLRRAPLDGQVDLVPGAESLLVHVAAPVTPRLVAQLRERIGALSHARPDEAPELRETGGAVPDVVIDTVYDGVDLDEVGRLTGLGADGVVEAHTGTPWQVAFCGFSPGFGYLAGGDPRLRVPRRSSPRTEVPCGAVGLAGEYSGIYPRPSPGGWQLVGRTGAALWDVRRDPPALLRPGVTVRFRPVRPSVTMSSGPAASPSASPEPRGDVRTPAPRRSDGSPALVVVTPGMQCTVQDLGRSGCAAMGVSPSGAADRGSPARANRLVGNTADAAVLEIVNGGAEFEARSDLFVAVTGAPVAITVEQTPGAAVESSRSLENDCAVALSAGARLRLGRPRIGLRTYVAVRGGIVVEPVLGSRSTDTLAALGPAPVHAGDLLPIGDALPTGGALPPGQTVGDPPPRANAPAPADRHDPTSLTILPGPQRDWLTDAAFRRLAAEPWTVSPASSRVGVRLTGPDLARARTGELASQGLVRGAVQLTPSGELVVFLADHPVTGGYPVVGVLTGDASDAAAQLRPGTRARFVTVAQRIERR